MSTRAGGSPSTGEDGAAQASRLAEILDLAMGRPTAERSLAIDELCAGDESLREQAHSLLRALQAAGHLLEPALPAPAARPLTGLTIGAYQVGERVGAGGMGVVYLAKDTRLNRTVALKALPSSLGADPVRRARLEREARILATLNHPNIAAIYGIEPAGADHGPVMVLEHVPGETLAQRLARGPISPEDSRVICGQILMALEAAHNAGIVHRDIKPANIMLTGDTAVKVLDFGVARDLVNAAAQPPSGTPELTFPSGTLAGTAAYMSPEQARGRTIDKRTDIWAFACVLYEMLSGKRAFDGETTSDTIANVLRAEPDYAALPAVVPPAVTAILRRCLEKDAEERLRDAGDVRIELEDAWEHSGQVSTETGTSRRPSAGRLAVLTSAALILGAAGAIAIYSRASKPAPAAASVRLYIDVPLQEPPRSDAYGGCLAFSPDCQSLIYSAGPFTDPGPQLYVRKLASFDVAPIPGSNHAFTPTFSPDGGSIVCTDIRLEGASYLKWLPSEGGVAHSLLEVPEAGFGLCWCDDGSIIYASGKSHALMRLDAEAIRSATPKPVAITTTPTDTGEHHFLPCPLPGSRTILFTCIDPTRQPFTDTVEAVTLEDGQRHLLVNDASMPRFVPPNLLFYRQKGAVFAMVMDPKTLRLSGEPKAMTSALNRSPNITFTTSPKGDLAYLMGQNIGFGSQLAWFERQPRPGAGPASQVVTPIFTGNDPIYTLRLSPEGKRIAYTTNTPTPSLWVHDTERSTTDRIWSGFSEFPVWTPDGRSIVFTTVIDGAKVIAMVPADGSAAPKPLYIDQKERPCFPTGFSPDGTQLLISIQTDLPIASATDIFVLDLTAPTRPIIQARPLMETRQDRVAGRFSPDGKLVAYSSTETGRSEVFLQPYPSLDRKLLVSTEGGGRPTWSADGRSLFYQYFGRVFSVSIETSPELKVGKPEVCLENTPGSRYDPAPDGTRFVLGRSPIDPDPPTRIYIVLNAAGELQQR